ncbi:MAG: GTPase HflX, partial [Nitrososphaera sp.]|nr:GTPase HflX [Nitrososphaera sp.]
GGGIGTRGPGEQKLEMDRRRIRVRIARLGKELEKLEARRKAARSRRKETEIPVVALIGYTNAGKTTLLNRLSGAASVAKNQLFTTLDPLARRVRLPDGETVVVTDTVGFLHHLPHHLIEAFKATLEETRDADLLLHVLDISHPLVFEHAEAVETVLNELELKEKPMITVFNKCDRLEDLGRLKSLGSAYQPSVGLSAKTGEGIEGLFQALTLQLGALLVKPTRVRIPVENASLVASIYKDGQVLERSEKDGSIELLVRIPAKLQAVLSAYLQSAS